MNKRSLINLIVNIVLGIVYAPVTLFSFLFLMGTEATIGETNPVLIAWTYIFSYTGFFMFLICPASILLGYLLYKKDRLIWSYIIRFLPVILLGLALIIDPIVMTLA